MEANLIGGKTGVVSPPGVQAQRLLLAAAESADRPALRALLESWGHAVEIAEHSDALLEALARPDAPSVLLLDADFPGLNSLSLIHRLQLKAGRRHTWTIVLASSSTQAGDPGKSGLPRQAGIDDILSRPIDEFDLRVSLHAALRLHRHWAEMTETLDAARFHADHDRLTGLWNRESLLKMLFQETDRSQRLQSPLTLLLLDLDQFGTINRMHGYDGGDRVLRQLASRFRRFLRSYDLAGRCGEDEFLIAMPGCTLEDARSTAARLRDAIADRPFDILQATVRITASFGISQSEGRSPLAVLREAESALGRAKLAGGNCIRFFVPAGGRSGGAPEDERPASCHTPQPAAFAG